MNGTAAAPHEQEGAQHSGCPGGAHNASTPSPHAIMKTPPAHDHHRSQPADPGPIGPDPMGPADRIDPADRAGPPSPLRPTDAGDDAPVPQVPPAPVERG